jgi:hypothetical protein
MKTKGGKKQIEKKERQKEGKKTRKKRVIE